MKDESIGLLIFIGIILCSFSSKKDTQKRESKVKQEKIIATPVQNQEERALEKKKQIVKELANKGMDVTAISKITGWSRQEIEKLLRK